MRDPDRLADLSVRELIARLASKAPTPGGGSAAALAGAMGAALVEMVGGLTSGRVGLERDEEALREICSVATARRTELLELAELDASAYDAVIAARRLPRETDDERAGRAVRVAEATREATRIPLRVAEAAADVLRQAGRIAPLGNPHAVSDAGVAAQLASASVRGAVLNVRINLPSLGADDPVRLEAAARIDQLNAEAHECEEQVLAVVGKLIG
ncbi:MAG: cyclodeaminase/cyclohydrolase family protein [Chloroflexota bacterium]|nr:cyclodeaminase/cyclohydrolase family protein [Chloroflexota bacterium]